MEQLIELIVRDLLLEEELEIDVRQKFVVQDALRKKFSTKKDLRFSICVRLVHEL